jgi:uncharacterized protein
VVDEAIDSLGLRLFKLHCSVGDYALTDERLDPLWRRLSDTGLPVVVHLGHSVAGNTEDGELKDLEAVLRRWPDARIILAHCAAPAVDASLALMRRFANLYADLTPVVFHLAPVQPGSLAGLEDRILFGSDMPSVAVKVEDTVASIRALGMSAHHEALVLGGTANLLVPPRAR